jgi:hypothetical protein
MEKQVFDRLKKLHGTHKQAAKELGVSYSRYNEWRWDPECIPEAMRKYLDLALNGNGTSTESPPPASGP